MPGLSPSGSRFERIITVINDGLTDKFQAFGDDGHNCWRCERNRSRQHWSLCEECRAYLSCETDHDPVTNIQVPTAGYFGWAHAAYLARHNAETS